jgi:hypothetical protein
MTTRLETLRAERDRLEANDEWDHPAHPWLCEEIEKLEAAEGAGQAAQASTPATAPAGDSVEALAADREAALVQQAAGRDVDASALVARYNSLVTAAGSAGAERVDVAQLARDLVGADADPSSLDDAGRSSLVQRFNQAARQRPEPRTTEVLRADLAGSDLGVRMRAAAALQQRGELDDAAAADVVGAYNAEVQAMATARQNLDPAAYPEWPAEVVEGLREVQEAQRAPADPLEAATRRFNEFVRAQKPPTAEETLAALGVEPEPESVTTSQEA